MADAMGRTVTTVRHEYVLNSPTNAVEVDKAVSWALRDLTAKRGENAAKWDDAITVAARDDEVVIYWEEVAR